MLQMCRLHGVADDIGVLAISKTRLHHSTTRELGTAGRIVPGQRTYRRTLQTSLLRFRFPQETRPVQYNHRNTTAKQRERRAKAEGSNSREKRTDGEMHIPARDTYRLPTHLQTYLGNQCRRFSSRNPYSAVHHNKAKGEERKKAKGARRIVSPPSSRPVHR